MCIDWWCFEAGYMLGIHRVHSPEVGYTVAIHWVYGLEVGYTVGIQQWVYSGGSTIVGIQCL